MDLSCTYLGLKLSTPLIVGASPFADDTYTARLVQDAGASAIVMRSLFEEQIYLYELAQQSPADRSGRRRALEGTVFPSPAEYQLNPDQYLRQIGQLKAALAIPVIASLNGCQPGGWIDFARRFESAGADAIELNLYHLVDDPNSSSAEIEAEMLETVRLMKTAVRIPVAVKLQPYYTALVHFARAVEQTGADGIILFNRLYQSEISAEQPEFVAQLKLSEPDELRLRLRWLSLLAPHVHCSLAVTGGVHSGEDAVKAILGGADAIQLVSALLKHGTRYLGTIAEGITRWMAEHGYTKISEFRGRMTLPLSPEATAIERGDYQRLLQSWRL